MTFWAHIRELFRPGDYVDGDTLKRVRATHEAQETLEESLGQPVARQRERVERAASAPNAYRRAPGE